MLSRVETVLRDVGQSVIMPLFRRLAAGDIAEKSPGEIVTTADRRAEAALVARLRDIAPDAVAVGEEGVAADPRILADFHAGRFARAWLIDPLDGTANFAAGDRRFAIMVALVEKGHAVASWIHEPASGRTAVCESGGGAFVDRTRIRLQQSAPAGPLRGGVFSRFLPPAERAIVSDNLSRIMHLPGSACAGRAYPDIAAGHRDFNLYWRLLPWDHAPGALFLAEAGGCVRYFDGENYVPAQQRSGLIAAASEAAWEQARSTLLAPRNM